MLDKTFDFKDAEQRLYAKWEEAGCFQPAADPDADPYCIVIPPPNVTGNLHMGHALNNTLQDVLCRFERMRGKSVLWQPGTDHAGIATQMVVERQLAETQSPTRQEMGREAFVEKVWEWKAQSGGAILNQLKRLGASCDWSRERFTLDEGLSEAVQKVFIALYKEGLIYRDKRLVNWDPKFQTAISDLEVENTEVQGHFWHFKYPLENGETYKFPIAHDEEGNPTEWEERDYIAIATTRPETMLGDGAVAVHPSDVRYAPIVGKRVLLPLADRYIPIIADEHPDPEFGSGAVKITGAHDFNDFQVAKRHDLPMYDIMDDAGRMAGPIPEKYKGMDRFEARKHVVADIDALGLLEHVEDKVIQQPFGDRSGVVVEPRLKDQWFVDAETLAKPAIAAVEEGTTKFVPENWSKTYFQWMRNIEPWCISRQLWWGHQIPAWFGPDGAHFVGDKEAEIIEKAKDHYGHDLKVTLANEHLRDGVVFGKQDGDTAMLSEVVLVRDPDVLDTWFSSQLWPFSTLGWPQETPELKRFYKTDVLVTGFDIIFFWVARMMMAGLHFMKEVPFHTVYIHALVRDEHGQKMSKSKGNVVDPLDLVEKYGADALRFFLTAMAAQGRDIRLSEQRVEGYRNFGTKLWNAARFCQMNECAYGDDFDPATVKSPLNQWILHEAAVCAEAVERDIDGFRFNDAAAAVYRFVWNVFCDWHLELAKPVLQGEDEAAKAETRATTAWVLDRILIMLHPFTPFITEELWGALRARDGFVMQQRWPQLEGLKNPAAAEEIDWAIRLITDVRSLRVEMNVPPGAKIPLQMIGASAESAARLERHAPLLKWLGRFEGVELAAEPAAGSAQMVHDEATIALPLAGVIDVAAEKARIEKEIAKAVAEIEKIDKKLGNESFVAKAPAAVVEEQKTRRTEHEGAKEKLGEALERLAALG